MARTRTPEAKRRHADRVLENYRANSEAINAERRRRYAEDAEYRVKKQEANRAFRSTPEFDRSKYRRSEKDGQLRRTYGITLDDYELMLLEQEGRCKACSTPAASEWALHVDHCHDSGAVRGLLCFGCNAALGNVGDDVDRVMQLVAYLLQTQEGTK